MKAILVIDIPFDIAKVHDATVDIISQDWQIYRFPFVKVRDLPNKITDIDTDSQFINGFRHGFNTCIEIIETNGENYVVQEEE